MSSQAQQIEPEKRSVDDSPDQINDDRRTTKDIEGVLEIDHASEKKLLRKVDRYVIPPVMLIYTFSFLDRVNIGNARLYGLEEDLGLTDSQYQTAVSLLFVTYIIFELPSNLVIKKLRPSRWLAFITTSWGIVATLTGIVQSYAGLIVCRLLLGAFEAGLFPGAVVYLSFFYTKREMALRVSCLFVSAAIAGSLGGLLAYGIGHMDGVAGLRGWRWIMIIEGIPTVIIGITIYFWMADHAESAYYLSDQERKMMIVRLNRQEGRTATSEIQQREDVYKAFKDWKVWMFPIAQFGLDTMLYGYSIFLPSIIRDMGNWSTAQVQALTIPCYALGAVTYLIVAWFSDKYQRRGLPTMVFALISIIGYCVLLGDLSSGVHYLGCLLVALGLYVAVGIPLAWLPSNQPRYGKRTTAGGLQLTVGNMSGIMASFLYKANEAPRYIRGHSVTLAMVAMGGGICAFMSFYFAYLNKRRRDGKEDDRIVGKTEEEIAEMGDENPRYVFTI